jgi:hypothetical protein
MATKTKERAKSRITKAQLKELNRQREAQPKAEVLPDLPDMFGDTMTIYEVVIGDKVYRRHISRQAAYISRNAWNNLNFCESGPVAFIREFTVVRLQPQAGELPKPSADCD